MKPLVPRNVLYPIDDCCWFKHVTRHLPKHFDKIICNRGSHSLMFGLLLGSIASAQITLGAQIDSNPVSLPRACSKYTFDALILYSGMDQEPAIVDLTQLRSAVPGLSYPEREPSQLYQTLPLFPGIRTIRLLDLSAPDANPDTTLSGTIRVVSLESCPRFASLSYVWGVGRTRSIACNGCSIPITQNCYDALLDLRALYGGITIWVDAICINQEDDGEKATQIALMGEIYTWSHTVYLRLGPADKRAERAIRFLSKLPERDPPVAGSPWIRNDRDNTVRRDFLSCAAKSASIICKFYFSFSIFTFNRKSISC